MKCFYIQIIGHDEIFHSGIKNVLQLKGCENQLCVLIFKEGRLPTSKRALGPSASPQGPHSRLPAACPCVTAWEIVFFSPHLGKTTITDHLKLPVAKPQDMVAMLWGRCKMKWVYQLLLCASERSGLRAQRTPNIY